MVDVSLDLEVQETGEWFEFFTSHIDPASGDTIYDDPVAGAPRIKIRGLAPFIEKRMLARKKAVEHVYNTKSRAMDRNTYYPELSTSEILAEREDTWDWMIEDFEDGFKDKKTGNVLKCTRENKIKMMKIPVFDRCVARCLQLLSESGVQEAAVESKNSLIGSSSRKTKLDPE